MSFFFSFLFHLQISENRRTKQILPKGVLVPVGGGRRWGNGIEGCDSAYIVHMNANGKMGPV
jgi:hypothetical protein